MEVASFEKKKGDEKFESWVIVGQEVEFLYFQADTHNLSFHLLVFLDVTHEYTLGRVPILTQTE